MSKIVIVCLYEGQKEDFFRTQSFCSAWSNWAKNCWKRGLVLPPFEEDIFFFCNFVDWSKKELHRERLHFGREETQYLCIKKIGLDLKQMYYSVRRLVRSRIIESTADCYQKLLVPIFLNSPQNTSLKWIIWLLLSFLRWPKVILLSDGNCIKYIAS